MGNLGINFIKGNAGKFERENGKIKATIELMDEKKQISQYYDTVLLAISRYPDVQNIGLDKLGIKLDNLNKIVVDGHWETSIKNVYAIGDIISGGKELTPVAIKEGEMVAKGLAMNLWERMDYGSVPTTLFTPIEYSFTGMGEEEAVKKYGEENVDVYHTSFKPLEWNFLETREKDLCYCKIIVKIDDRRVIGIHYLGPNAGEVMQGFAMSVRLGLKYEDIVNTIGIHPTCAEELVKVRESKRENKNVNKEGC